MFIRVDKYTIERIPYNFVLKEEITYTTKENIESTKEKIIGYYSLFESCLKALLNHEIAESESKSIDDLLETIQKAEKKIDDIIKKMEEKGINCKA